MRGAFLRLVGTPNESLRLIIILWQQNNFGRVTSDPKKPIKGSISRKIGYKDLVFVRREFLSVVGAQNQSLIIYYIKLHILGLNKFARFTSEPNNQSKGSI